MVTRVMHISTIVAHMQPLAVANHWIAGRPKGRRLTRLPSRAEG